MKIWELAYGEQYEGDLLRTLYLNCPDYETLVNWVKSFSSPFEEKSVALALQNTGLYRSGYMYYVLSEVEVVENGEAK